MLGCMLATRYSSEARLVLLNRSAKRATRLSMTVTKKNHKTIRVTLKKLIGCGTCRVVCTGRRRFVSLQIKLGGRVNETYIAKILSRNLPCS
jgi:hypothetical protein